MATIAEVLDKNKQIGPGFDFMRVFLALSVVLLHSLTVTNQYFVPYNLDNTPLWIVHYSLVPMFFALSAFLVSASAERLSPKNFLINRVMRIIPALTGVTFVSALIIGPLFTSVSLRDYFFSFQFAAFFLNIIGWVRFTLPGVFMTHAVAEVNGSLWTVPFELSCYVMVSGLILLRVMQVRWLVPAFLVVYLVASVLVQTLDIPDAIHWHGVGKIISVAFIEHESQPVTAFLFGIVLYQNRHHILYSRWLFGTCLALVFGIVFAFPSMTAGGGVVLRFILMPALVYITVFLGLTPLRLPRFFRTGDYSYGIYLYHQPFLQVVMSLFPAMALVPVTGVAFTFLAGLPFFFGAAWLSWHLVERPLLKLRKNLSLTVRIHNLEAVEPGETAAVPVVQAQVSLTGSPS